MLLQREKPVPNSCTVEQHPNNTPIHTDPPACGNTAVTVLCPGLWSCPSAQEVLTAPAWPQPPSPAAAAAVLTAAAELFIQQQLFRAAPSTHNEGFAQRPWMHRVGLLQSSTRHGKDIGKGCQGRSHSRMNPSTEQPSRRSSLIPQSRRGQQRSRQCIEPAEPVGAIGQFPPWGIGVGDPARGSCSPKPSSRALTIGEVDDPLFHHQGGHCPAALQHRHHLVMGAVPGGTERQG